LHNIVFSNLVFGEPYTTVFLELHLKSFLASIVNARLGTESIYLIYSDGSNIQYISQHRNFQKLTQHMEVHFISIDQELNYQSRYQAQTIQFQHSARISFERNALMHQACADVYYGIDFWSNACNIMTRMDVDGLFGFALRTTLDSTFESLKHGSFDNDALFDIGYSNMHPVWAFANWDSPYFTKYPYTIIWSSPDQIVCRAFSVPAILFKPSSAMFDASGCGDISVLPLCERIYVERDWHVLPALEVGMLQAFFPPFSRQRSSIEELADWARRHLPAPNFPNLFHYQVIKKRTTLVNQRLIDQSLEICRRVVTNLNS